MYRGDKESWIKHLDFALIDIVCILVAYSLAYIVRHDSMLQFDSIYGGTLIILMILHIFTTIFFDSYKNILRRGYLQELKHVVFHANEMWLGLVLIIYLLHNAEEFSRTVFFCAWFLQIILCYVAHLSRRGMLTKQFQKNARRALVIITETELADKVIRAVRRNERLGLKIRGIILIDQDQQGECIDNIPIVASKETIEEYLCRNWVDEVFIQYSDNKRIPMELVKDCHSMGVTVHFGVSGIDEIDDNNWIFQKISGYSVITYSLKMLSYRQVLVKRCVDICGGLIGSIMTGVIFLILTPIIYIKSPGPVIFKQTRIGKNGRKFKVYKFRSMYLDAEERKANLSNENVYNNGFMFKMENDPRIISGVGSFIRRHNIDEFPQFINVLKGDMSLVGTRPPTVEEWENYMPNHRARMATKPGITGAWQIAGKNKALEFDKIVDMDVDYIKNYSFISDIKIILETVRIMFCGTTLEKS